jgi:hypothetical protein
MMSAPVLTLPDRANVEFLKKEARDLHKAFRAGAADAIDRIVTFLPRAINLSMKASTDELTAFDLSRQETQHALACSYGCGKWEELLDTVRVQNLDALDSLSDRSVQIALREVDQQDLVRVLPTLSDASVARFYHNMSEQVQVLIKAEVRSLGAVDSEEVAQSKARVRETLVELGRQGWMKWEDPDTDRSGPPLVDLLSEERFVHMGKPLLQVSEPELSKTFFQIAEQARWAGILSLQPLVSATPTLLTEALQYIVDGTEPDLVQDLVETRGATILRHRTVRGQMAIEGWMSIQSLDNPAIVRIKLETYFRDTLSKLVASEGRVVLDDLVARLRDSPLMSMSDEDWAEFYVELAIIARRDGIGALEPLVAVVDDEVLSTGLKATIMDRLSAAQILAVMKDSVQDLRVRLKRREAMVLAGSLGIQMGHKPQDLVEVARTAAVESGQRIHDAGYPRPTA